MYAKKNKRFWIIRFFQIVASSSRRNINSTNALIDAFIDSDDEPFYDKVASDEESHNNQQEKRTKMMKKSKKVRILEEYLFKLIFSGSILAEKRTDFG
jgi:hypothetical protein